MNNIGFQFPNLGSNISEQMDHAMEKFEQSFNSSIPLSMSELVYSDTQFQILKEYILAFQDSLDNEHDVGLMLTNFGTCVVMQVTEIGFVKPVLMVFKGYVNGHLSTLIQHVNQLNFLLTTTEKPTNQPKRVIGFTVSSEK